MNAVLVYGFLIYIIARFLIYIMVTIEQILEELRKDRE